MPITYTTYPAPTRSHHSTRAKRSLSRSYRSPSHYGGSEHGQGYRHSGTYAGSTHSHGSGLGRVYAYDTGHHRSGSHGYPQNYYHASSTRPHSRSLTKTHYDPRGYATTSHQPEYFVSDDAGMSNQAGYYTSHHGRRPSLGERLKWLFGMGHKNYHTRGKRSRDMLGGGKSRPTHDRYGRHIYAV